MLLKIGTSPSDEKLHLLLISRDGEATEFNKFSAFPTVPQYNVKCPFFCFKSVLKMVLQSCVEPIYLSCRFPNLQGESVRAVGVKEFRLFPKILAAPVLWALLTSKIFCSLGKISFLMVLKIKERMVLWYVMKSNQIQYHPYKPEKNLKSKRLHQKIITTYGCNNYYNIVLFSLATSYGLFRLCKFLKDWHFNDSEGNTVGFLLNYK